MDITLIRSFLEVAATGSFVHAADRLFVTQSAVSQRILRLEEQLGRPLFARSKAGVSLTPAGREFESYALSLIKIWEEARQQIAVPEGFSKTLSIGAQYSLWPRLGFRLIDSVVKEMPDVSIRAEIGLPDRLTRYLLEGVIQFALMYTPQLRPGLRTKELLSEELILCASWSGASIDTLSTRYIMVDWGAEFVQAHALHLPNLTNPGMTFSLGAMTAEFIRSRKMAAYLPARYARRFLDDGSLHLVPEAPTFSHPAWAVWRDDLDPKLSVAIENALSAIVDEIEKGKDEVLKDLADLNEDGEVAVLGQIENWME
ncbi:MAG: LysR family transcriptional regulator [Boseongicola sp.]|nr:LysR family transcriptional regulator [Boseongicola sp.]